MAVTFGEVHWEEEIPAGRNLMGTFPLEAGIDEGSMEDSQAAQQIVLCLKQARDGQKKSTGQICDQGSISQNSS